MEENCQYYIDIDDDSSYWAELDSDKKETGYYLPEGFSFLPRKEEETDNYTTRLSYKYRGKRYGFAQ
jgi:hypothetical protein